MDQTNETRLGSAPLGKLLFQLGLPGVAAQVINVLYNIVDRIYIGNIPGIGDMALTGVGVTLPVIMVIAAFSAFVGMGGAPLAPSGWARGIMRGRSAFWEAVLFRCSPSLSS